MREEIIKQLIQVNKDFYKRIGEEFSRTRKSSWYGWYELIDILKNHAKNHSASEYKVLDLGCGNGRFYKFLNEILPVENLNYLGVDFDDKLLAEASVNYGSPNSRFLKADMFNLDLIEKFDLVVCFGIAHHLPGRDYRKQWFENITKYVSPNGVFVFTVWNFSNKNNFDKAVRSYPEKSLSENDLEPGDYFIGWNNLPGVYRYSHDYTNEELIEINKILENRGFSLIKSFDEDGTTRNLNKYFVYQVDAVAS